MKLSQRSQSMQHSPIRKFNAIAQDAKEKGKKVYHLNIGQPDIETPACFFEAVRAFDAKVVAYAESGGVTRLQDAIAGYFQTYDMDFGRADILITNGGSEALSMVFLSILNPGDEVVLAEPFYTNYHTFVTMAGGVIVPIPTKAEEGYHYADRGRIEAVITPKTKAICCISPGNPTGNVLTLEEMQCIGQIAKERDLWIVADEVYREFVYDDRAVTSFGMLGDLRDRVILVDSVSKRFSACGARIGCVATKNAELMDGLMKIAQGRLSCPTLDQVGAAALYGLGEDYYGNVRAEYRDRRDVVFAELMKIPGVVCQKPGGSFYVTVRLPVEDAEDFLMWLLTGFEDAGETVMFAPAQGFYVTPGAGRDEIRIAYVLKAEDMRRGVELIRLGLEAYNAGK